MTTWSIDYAFMIDNGELCTREEMERVGWDETRDTVLVSEDLATGGIRAHLVFAKRKRRPVDSQKDQGRHRQCACSYKLDEEPAQRAVIAKRVNAPTILVNSPVGDSQSNGPVETQSRRFEIW